jgi:hypothetical protein
LSKWVCFQKQICLIFWAHLIRIEKRNNFVEENFSIQAIFLWENSIWKFNFSTTKMIVPFFPSLFSHVLLWENREGKKGTTVFVEFSNWVFSKKKCLNWKKFFCKVVSFFNTNQISAEKQAHFFEETNPLEYFMIEIWDGRFGLEESVEIEPWDVPHANFCSFLRVYTLGRRVNIFIILQTFCLRSTPGFFFKKVHPRMNPTTVFRVWTKYQNSYWRLKRKDSKNHS